MWQGRLALAGKEWRNATAEARPGAALPHRIKAEADLPHRIATAFRQMNGLMPSPQNPRARHHSYESRRSSSVRMFCATAACAPGLTPAAAMIVMRQLADVPVSLRNASRLFRSRVSSSAVISYAVR